MRRARAFRRVAALLVAAGAAVASGEDGAPRILPALISADTALDGTWTLERDLVVGKGATLRLRPGARIVVGGPDAGAAGDFPGLCEIVVHGRIAAEGTAQAPVVFDGGPGGQPPAPSWHGIVLCADRMRSPDSVLSHAKFRAADEAVSVADGAPRVERCVFHECRTAISAASIRSADDRLVEDAKAPEPGVVECLFAACSLGVHTEAFASPRVVRSSFLDCETGVGNHRWRRTWQRPRVVGASLDRCFFLRNRTAVEGPSEVENSVFVGNDVVFEVSTHHGDSAEGIDRIAWRRNLVWSNGTFAAGESDVGDEQSAEDPRLVAVPALPSFESAAAPLRVEFGAGSPALGRALDGGDLGPSGAGPRGRSRRLWTSAARAIPRALLLGPPEKVDAAKLPKAAPAAPGERVGDAWWAAFPVDEGGCLDRAALAWAAKVPTLAVAWTWTAPAEGVVADLEVNVDGRAAVWRAGAAVPFPLAVLRSGVRGVSVPMASAGAPGVVVWWQSDDAAPRLGVAVSGAGGAPIAAPSPSGEPETLAAEPMRFGPKHVGVRVRCGFHWADLARPGVFRIRAAGGTEADLSARGVSVFDAKGTLRADLPEGVAKGGAVVVIDGLRDAWGRTLGGQPLEIPAEPAR